MANYATEAAEAAAVIQAAGASMQVIQTQDPTGPEYNPVFPAPVTYNVFGVEVVLEETSSASSLVSQATYYISTQAVDIKPGDVLAIGGIERQITEVKRLAPAGPAGTIIFYEVVTNDA
jgi:hypothetical protein